MVCCLAFYWGEHLKKKTPDEQKPSRIKLGFNGPTVLVVEGQRKRPQENHKMDWELGQPQFVLRVSFATYIQNTIPGKRKRKAFLNL